MKNLLSIPRFIALAIVIVAGLLINYLFLPAWSFNSGGLYAFVFVVGCIALFCFIIAEYDDDYILTVPSGIVVGISIVAIIIGVVTSAQIFHARQYQSLIEVEEGNFSEIANSNINNLAVVDVDTAERLGDRTLAGLSNPSWYDVDNEYNLIVYNGSLYRISPINYGGFFIYTKA